MRLSDFDYELPSHLIAQRPSDERDAARLLYVPAQGPPVHHRVRDLPTLVAPGTLLVLNDTQVIPARLRGRKASGGRVELLLWRRNEAGWSCLYGSAKPPRPGVELVFGGPDGVDTIARAEIVGRDADEPELVVVRFDRPDADVLTLGEPPLPPYIERPEGPSGADVARYQTVFARRPGAVAAPTAGLHFTPALLEALAARGVELAWLTLHVGPGTFRPVREELVEKHRMHREPCLVPDETARAVGRALVEKRPVMAVGTTALRALESAALVEPGADRAHALRAGEGSTDLFIRPGYRFRVVDRLLTNFHLPRSTLIMLAAAFAGRRRLLEAYATAVEHSYRFYSYGDATLLDRAFFPSEPSSP